MNLQREWSKLFIFLFVLLTQRNDLFSPHTEHIFLPRKNNKKNTLVPSDINPTSKVTLQKVIRIEKWRRASFIKLDTNKN